MTDVRMRRVGPEDREPDTYDRFLAKQKRRIERARNGEIVLRRDERRLEESRQGFLRWYLNSNADDDDETARSALQDWDVFVHEIRKHSGMHRHQGGLVIYVIAGEGYTLVDGERIDWKAGDLLLLPVKPGGVAHQHFNLGRGVAEWVALIYRPMHNAVGSYIEQMQEAPGFGGGQ